MALTPIQTRRVRGSLLKSGINIRKIGDAMNDFGRAIMKSSKTTGDLVEATNDSVKFKNRLIKDDDRFFRKRREAIRRRDNEDLIEASTITGVVKTTGKIRTRSTKGFLGRIMDFFGILFLGWGLKYLPSIIKGAATLMKTMGRLVLVLKDYLSGTFNILKGFGGSLLAISKSLFTADFTTLKGELEDNMTRVVAGFSELLDAFEESLQMLTDPLTYGFNMIKKILWQKGEAPPEGEGMNKGGLVEPSEKSTEISKPQPTVKMFPTELKMNTGGSVKAKKVKVGYDTIPAWLTSGEYVITSPVVNDLGEEFFNIINSMSYHPTIKDIDVTEDQTERYRKFAQRLSSKWEFAFKSFVSAVNNEVDRFKSKSRSVDIEYGVNQVEDLLESESENIRSIANVLVNTINTINRNSERSMTLQPNRKSKEIFVPFPVDDSTLSPSIMAVTERASQVVTKVETNMIKILQDLKYSR